MYLKYPNNWEYITSIKCVGVGRDILPNMLILNGKQHFKKCFKRNNLEDNIYLAINNFCYFNNEIKV